MLDPIRKVRPEMHRKDQQDVIDLTFPMEEEPNSTIDQNHEATTPTRNKEADESTVSSPDLSPLKRPTSTPFRHQMHHVRLRGLRRSFKKRRAWIQGKTEETNENCLKNNDNFHSQQECDDTDSECDIMDGHKGRRISSTVRRKRVRLLRGLVRTYCGDTDSDDSDSDRYVCHDIILNILLH